MSGANEEGKMRLFIAISLPSEVKKRLFGLGRPLPGFGDVKAVEEENIHLTLKFLGDTEPEPVIKALEKVKFRPFEVSLKGVGAFPSPSYVRVVWAGCEKGAQEIITLHKDIEEALKAGGLKFEKDRDFHPHATLARVRMPKDRKGLLDFLDKHKAEELGSFKAGSFELMQSLLGRGGPTYAVVKRFS